MQIPTPRLLLRDFVESDVASVFSYQSDPLYLQHSLWATRSESESRAFVHMLIGWVHEEPRTKYQLAIVRQDAVIGNCGIRLASHSDSEAEYGCELAPSFWGNGYAAEAGRAMLAFGFRTLRLQRVFSETVSTNTAAIAIAGRLGMKPEGCPRERQRIKDRLVDTLVFSIAYSDWSGES